MTRHAQSDAGFSLLEVVVSLTLLSAILVSLGGLMLQAARGARSVGNLTPVYQAVTQQVNRVSVLPYDSLALGSTCKGVNTSGLSYTYCVQVDSVQTSLKRITLTVTPANPNIKPVTEVFLRGKPPTSHALSVSY